MTFRLEYKGKNWLIKLFATFDLEKKGIKEYFFYKYIFPALYSTKLDILCFKKVESTDYFVLVRELLDLEALGSININTSKKILSLLKRLHYNNDIKSLIEKEFKKKLNFFGEIIGKTYVIKNSSSSHLYFQNAITYWEQNLDLTNSNKENKHLFQKLKSSLVSNIDVLEPSPYLVHSDVSISNLMVDKKGEIILLDFENFFSFHKELDFISLFFLKDFAGNYETPRNLINKEKTLRQIKSDYFEDSISLSCLRKRINALSSYKILRGWNYSVRIKNDLLAEKIVKSGFDFIKSI